MSGCFAWGEVFLLLSWGLFARDKMILADPQETACLILKSPFYKSFLTSNRTDNIDIQDFISAISSGSLFIVKNERNHTRLFQNVDSPLNLLCGNHNRVFPESIPLYFSYAAPHCLVVFLGVRNTEWRSSVHVFDLVICDRDEYWSVNALTYSCDALVSSWTAVLEIQADQVLLVEIEECFY